MARRERQDAIGSGSILGHEGGLKKRSRKKEKERQFGKLRDDLYGLYVKVRRLKNPEYQPGGAKVAEDKETLLDLAEMLSSRDIDPVDYMSYVANCCEKTFPNYIASEGRIESYESDEYRSEENHFAHLKGLEDSAKVMDPEFVLRRGIRQGNDPLALHLFALSHGFDIEKPRKLKEDATTCWILAGKKQRTLIKQTHPEAAEVVDEMARKGS